MWKTPKIHVTRGKQSHTVKEQKKAVQLAGTELKPLGKETPPLPRKK